MLPPRKFFSGFTLSLFLLAALQSLAPAAEVGLRIRFGLTDNQPKSWNGTATVAPGKVTLISGWRFEQGDNANGTEGWTASTRPASDFRTNQQKAKAKANTTKTGAAAKAKAKAKAGGNTSGLADNGVLITLTDVTESSVVQINTDQGNFSFSLSEIPYGKYIERLDSAVEIERTAAPRQLTSDRKTDDDYPSAAIAPDGTLFLTFTSYTPGIDRNERTTQWDRDPGDLSFLAKAPGGDQLFVRAVKNGTPAESIPVTDPGCDIYKSAISIAGDGTAWIFWSQNKNYKPFPNNPQANFDIWARPLKGGRLGEAVQISASTENDVWPVAATDSAGNVWIAWQGARNGVFKILARRQEPGYGLWTPEQVVSTQSKSCWAPAICATTLGAGLPSPPPSALGAGLPTPPPGKIAIAWDTYEKGDYDIWLREFDNAGKPSESRPAANTDDYEARPALAYDKQGALWVAYEESGASWGKDWSGGAPFETRDGIALYKDRQIGLAVLKDGQWHETSQLLVGALPGADPRRRRGTEAAAARPATGPLADADEGAAIRGNVHNNIARIICDANGRIWLLARARQNDFRSQIGSVWMTHAAYFDGSQWTGPILIPHTDNLLYNNPAAAPLPGGGLAVVHSTDHRQDRHTTQRGANPGGQLSGNDPFDNDLYLSRLEHTDNISVGNALSGVPTAESSVGNALRGVPSATPALVAAKVQPNPSAQPSAASQKERSEIDRIRAYRANIGGQNLRITRGEFHRHTEISGDGGNDGPLEDMWRYAIDVANMDWLGCGDHDNGGHREYPWWLTQKTTDAFHLPGVFEPPFTHERSVRYPEGHRNAVFIRRGIRTLPRLPITDRDNVINAPDTALMYKYLHLFDGVCAVHTSATTMGTDWRDNDPLVEPMVEIYQGCRMNYERPGAPRCPTEDFNLGGFEPKGFINLALLKGIKFSFQSSSDHGSTHISYALVYAENNSRDAMLKAMKQRHTYAATDNIIADFRSKSGDREYMMGDAFTTSQKPSVHIKLVGTQPFAKVTLIKDDIEHVLGSPNTPEFELTWTDPSPIPNKESYYYIRGEQTDGELVWASPIWITYRP